MPSSTRCRLVGPIVFVVTLLSAGIASAKEVKKAFKVHEGKKEVTIEIVCKDEDGRIIKPATLTYTQTGKSCTVSPASGTVSADGKWKVKLSYAEEGTDTIEFTCGAGTWTLKIKVECIKKPKRVITGENAYLPPDPEQFYQMVDTQDALGEAFLSALAREPLPGAADEHLEKLISLLSGIEPAPPPVDPIVLSDAILELKALIGSERVDPDRMAITDLVIDQYDRAATRYFQSGDCNGNGRLDLEDLADGTSGDADQDLVPDDCNCPPVLFDADSDRDVDMDDFGVFQACLTGPTVLPDIFNALPLMCRCLDTPGADLEPNGAIDRDDFAVFLLCATGPAPDPTRYDPACDLD